jgi:hypothetical protein
MRWAKPTQPVATLVNIDCPDGYKKSSAISDPAFSCPEFLLSKFKALFNSLEPLPKLSVESHESLFC